MDRKKSNEVSLKDAIDGFMKSFHLEHRVNEQKIRNMWSELMGPSISRYTTYLNLRDGVLTITLNSAPLRQDMSFQKDMIRRRINDELGQTVVKEVVIR